MGSQVASFELGCWPSNHCSCYIHRLFHCQPSLTKMAHNTYNSAYNFAYNEGGLANFVWKNLWGSNQESNNQGQGNYQQQPQQQQQQQQQQQSATKTHWRLEMFVSRRRRNKNLSLPVNSFYILYFIYMLASLHSKYFSTMLSQSTTVCFYTM